MAESAFNILNRRTYRSEANPLDKSTIVSVYPKEITEIKLTLQPGKFVIPAGTASNPGILVIGSSSWWKDVGENEPLLEIPVYSPVMAKSIIDDYIMGILGAAVGESGPGLFFVPGEYTVAEIKLKYKAELDIAIARQNRWYNNLIKMGDALWSRTNGNPLSIGDDMRFAARELGKDKVWIKDFQAIELIPCVACGAMRNPAFPICPNCKNIVDLELAKKLNFKSA
jgi:hypothetical protein